MNIFIRIKIMCWPFESNIHLSKHFEPKFKKKHLHRKIQIILIIIYPLRDGGSFTYYVNKGVGNADERETLCKLCDGNGWGSEINKILLTWNVYGPSLDNLYINEPVKSWDDCIEKSEIRYVYKRNKRVWRSCSKLRQRGRIIWRTKAGERKEQWLRQDKDQDCPCKAVFCLLNNTVYRVTCFVS